MFSSIQIKLRNLEDYMYKPSILVADGGDQITSGFLDAFCYTCSKQFTRFMCWALVHRNFQEYAYKFIKEDKEKDDVLNDIDVLQVMPSPEDFSMLVICFLIK